MVDTICYKCNSYENRWTRCKKIDNKKFCGICIQGVITVDWIQNITEIDILNKYYERIN